MGQVTLRRSGTHHYLFTSTLDGSLHFPPLGDSHPSYWPAARHILAQAREVLAREGKYLPHEGSDVEISTSEDGLVALVEQEVEAQSLRQQAVSEAEADEDLEAELDAMGY